MDLVRNSSRKRNRDHDTCNHHSYAGKEQASQTNRAVRIRSGMVVLEGFLSQDEQAQLAMRVATLGEQPNTGFYQCNNEKTKRMRMMNLGLRTDGRNHALDIPAEWISLAARACREAAGVDPSIHLLRPDICVVNHYNSASRLGWHQDLFSSRDPALPVVSVSLGQAAKFQYRLSWGKRAKPKTLMLQSGDVLVFGGKSRGIIHGVPSLCSTDSSAGNVGCSVPDDGRYNLNFREL